MKRTTCLIALAAALLAWSCTTIKRTAYVDTEARFELVQRVAVLPFQNLSTDQFAAEKVQRIFTIELLAEEVVDVVDPGAVGQALRQRRIQNVGELSADDIRQLGEIMKADAIIVGEVHEFGLDRRSQTRAPEVSITCRMLTAATGETLWSVSVSRGGAGVGSRLFGIEGDTVIEATRKVVRKALKSLIE